MRVRSTDRAGPSPSRTRRRRANTASAVVLAAAIGASGPAGAEPALRSEIVAASDSVLLAVSFGSLGERPQIVPTDRIAEIDPTGLTPPFDRRTRTLIQGAFCRLNRLERCPIFDGEVQGTAFVLAQPGEIVTCRHIVQDWLHWASALNGGRLRPTRLVPPIFLADRSRTATLSTWETGYVPLLFVDDPALGGPLARLADDDAFWDADVIAFQLASPALPAPLPRGEVPRRGERVHAIGYATDPGGVRLHAVAGRVLRSEGIEIETDAATRHGMSGAPLVDDQGRATAISCGREHRRDGRAGALALPLDVDVWAGELRDRRGMVPIVDPKMR
jgi:hypothetical protein